MVRPIEFDWTEEAVAKARDLYENTTLSASEIGRKFGVGKGSILGLSRRKGFVERGRLFNNALVWTPEEDAILRGAFDEGKNDVEVARLLPDRSRAGVKNRRTKLNIVLNGAALAYANDQGAISRNVIDARRKRWERDKSNPQPPQTVHAIFPADLHCEAVDYTPEHRGCRWMISGGRPWTVCAGKRAPGESYCWSHQARSMRHPELMEQAA